MKIAIPAEAEDLKAKVCASFGRAPYYLYYDTESNESEFAVNSAASSAGGAGVRAAQSIVDNKPDAVITERCGENAAEVLKAAGIKIYKSKDISIKENIDALAEGKLDLLDEIHPGLHLHGSNRS